jgi:hypothetical protein
MSLEFVQYLCQLAQRVINTFWQWSESCNPLIDMRYLYNYVWRPRKFITGVLETSETLQESCFFYIAYTGQPYWTAEKNEKWRNKQQLIV